MSVINHVQVLVTCAMPGAAERLADVARTCGLGGVVVSPVMCNGWQTLLVPTSGGKDGRETALAHEGGVMDFLDVVREATDEDILWGCTITVLRGEEYGPLRVVKLSPRTPGGCRAAHAHPGMAVLLNWRAERIASADAEERLREEYSWGMGPPA